AFVSPSSDSNGSDVIDPERGLTDVISLGRGEVVKGIDAGIVYVEPTAVIAGRYFCDDDADDLDTEDPSVPGALVTLLTADGAVVARTKTDADGNYEFTDLAAGDYVVQFATDDAPGKAFVSPSSDSNGSDVIDPDRGLTDVISLGRGEVVKGIDAGIAYVEPACPTPSAVLIDFLDAAFAFDFPSDKDSDRVEDATGLEHIVRDLPDKVLHDIAGHDGHFAPGESPEGDEFCQLADLLLSAFADRFDFA
ncbi:MAG: SdrD B-like domain-containing protein, partial [Pseudomonadota bacterium]